ncbi:MAG: hypothetical protein ACE5II_04935 [Anaerolineae bacterium]
MIYVADSQAHKLEANIETMRNLEENLRELGYNPFDIPLVLQFNKRDLPDAIAVEVLRSYLARDRCPQLEAVAIRGQGVIDTLRRPSTWCGPVLSWRERRGERGAPNGF